MRMLLFAKQLFSSSHLPLSDPLDIIKSAYSTLYETARGTAYVYTTMMSHTTILKLHVYIDHESSSMNIIKFQPRMYT
jgi:hypothetical protein